MACAALTLVVAPQIRARFGVRRRFCVARRCQRCDLPEPKLKFNALNSVILRPAVFAGRRTSALCRQRRTAGKMHRSFASLSDCLIRQGKVCRGNVENAQAGGEARERFPHFHGTGGYDGTVVVASEAVGKSCRRASRALALSRIRSLWARATRITFFALPAAARRWEKAAKSGW